VVRPITATCQVANTLTLLLCLVRADVTEDIAAALSHKVTKVQVETLKWLGACLSSLDKAAVAKLGRDVLPLVLKCTDDAAPAVRDGALAVIAVFVATASDVAVVAKAVESLDATRKKRLSELARGADAPQPSPSTTAVAAKQQPADAGEAAKRRPATAGGAARASVPSAARAQADDSELADYGGASADDVAAALEALVGPGIVARLGSAEWKERLEAANALSLALAAKPADQLASHCDCVLRQLGNSPGWEDRNFQVLLKCLDIVAFLARSAPGFSKRNAVIAFDAVTDKVADPKLKAAAAEVLTCWAAALGPRFVCAQLYKRAQAHKNPKVLELALAWILAALQDSGSAAFDVSQLVEIGSACLGHTNPGVKTAAIKLMGAAHAEFGPAVAGAVVDLKPALLATLQTEFARCPYQPSIAAARKPSAAAAAAPTVARSSSSAAAAAAVSSADVDALETSSAFGDAQPREDCSAKFTAKLVKELGSGEWKVRQAALEGVEAVVNEAGHHIAPSLGLDLMPALRARLNDTNKMLTIQALGTIGLLAVACGPGGATERAFRPVFPELLKTWADPKKQMREAVSKALSCYAETQPLERVAPSVAACVSDPKMPADGKRDALNWLLAAMRDVPSHTDLAAVFLAAAGALGDKAADIRELGAQLARAAAEAVGPEGVARAMRTLPREAQAALSERLGALAASRAPPALAPEDSAVLRAAAAAARPGTAPARPGTAAAARPGSAAGVRGSRTGPLLPARPASGLSGASGACTGPLILACPLERKEERLSKLPRKALGAAVGGKDFGSDVREAAAEELSAAAAPYLRADLHALLFTDDFKRHMQAAEELEGCLGCQLEEVVAVTDLLLRWSVMRLCETAPNTSALLRVLDWLMALLDALRGAGYRLREEEAVVLLPVVLDKAGHNLPAVRERFRRLMHAACGVYPVSRFCQLLGVGLGSKNSRSRVECLECLHDILARHGFEVVERAGARVLPPVAQLVGERDPALRKAALEALGAAWRCAGEALWRHLGPLSEVQHALLEAHFKKTQRAGAAEDGRGAGAGLLPRTSDPGGAPARAPPPGGLAQLATPPRVDTRPPANLQSTALSAAAAASTPLQPDATPAGSPLAQWAQALAVLAGGGGESEAVSAKKVVVTLLKDLSSGGFDESVACVFVTDADRLVQLLSAHVARLFAAACGCATQPAPSRGCKYALNALMQTFSVARLAQAVAEPTVRRCVGELLLLLLDERVPGIEEGSQLVRALNVLMLKVLENASRTSSFTALLLMLRTPPGALAAADGERRVRFFDLVVKCLIKLTRTLSVSLAGLDVSEVLLTVHSFFMVLGVEEIRRRGAEDDRPLRMVKTVLYELTKVLGPAIRTHLTKVPPPTFDPPPIIYAYIDLNLQSLTAAPAPAPAPAPALAPTPAPAVEEVDAPEASPPISTPPSAPAPPTPGSADQPARAQLASIFRKIGDKATTGDGIEELYGFKEAHPGIDITPHLAKTSDAFQLYIQRGLAKVEAARMGGGAPEGAAEPAGKSAVEAYQERLQRVKAASAAQGGAAMEGGGAVSISRQNLDALRERLRSVAAMTAAAAEPTSFSATMLTDLAPAADPTLMPPPPQPAPAVVPAAPAPAAPMAPPAPAPVPAYVARPAPTPATVTSPTKGASMTELQARMARIRELSQKGLQ